MKQLFSKSMILISSVTCYQAALAQDFNNATLSPIMISPAQNHQYKTNTFDSQFSLNNSTSTSKVKTSNSETEIESTGTDFAAGGIYRAPGLPLSAGLKTSYATWESKVKPSETKSEGNDTSLNPNVSVDLDPNITLGLDVEILSRETTKSTTTGDIKNKESITKKRVGIAYHDDKVELGVAFQPKIGEKEEDDYKEGSRASLHGRYNLDPSLTLGAIIERVHHSEISDNSKDALESSITAEAKPIDKVSIEGIYSYKASHAKESELLDASNAGHHKLFIGADYAVNKTMTVGGFLDNKFVSDTSNSKDIQDDEMSLGIRGSVTF